MGTLKPDATYVYERNGSEVYAREFNSSERKLIGYTYEGEGSYHISDGIRDFEDHVLWNEIRQAAKTNPALQKAIDRVKLIYRLSKDDPK